MRRTLNGASALLILIGLTFAYAQQPLGPPLPVPRITSAFPSGGQAGTTLEVTVNGTDIDEPTGLVFSHPDIKADVVSAPEPAVDPKTKMKAKAKTGPATSAKFKVTIPANVPLGQHDLRVASKLGLSNPRAFTVGDRPEVLESDKPHNDLPLAQKIELGQVVNGTIASATDVDYYSFAAKAGTRVLAYCTTTSIDSKARPQMELFDSAGKRLQINRNYREGDALLDFQPLSDGDYFIRIADFAYQNGGPDFFYRLSVNTAPFIDAVFPPAVKPGVATPVTLIGRNLPGGKPLPGLSPDGRPLESLTVTVTPPADAAGKFAFRGFVPPTMALQDAFEYSLKGPGGLSNSVPIFLTNSPLTLEAEADNDKAETAQAVELPCEIVGRIEKRYDKDWYSFTAKKGDVYHFDLQADRIGSGMDTYFVVKNLANMGNVVEEQDDDPEALHPVSFFSRSGDPAAARFTAPADGKFAVLVASRESNITFGPRAIYRLRITKPEPDFRAIVMPKGRELPSSTVADQGGQVGLDLFIDRRDGFNGTVAVSVDGLPAGATAKPVTVGHGVRWGSIVVAVKPDAAAFNGIVTVKCTAEIGGRKVVRNARPASITWALAQQQQNTPLIARLDQSLFFSIRPEKAYFRVAADLANGKLKTKDKDGKDTETKLESPLYVKPGDKLTIPVKVSWLAGEARANPVNVHLEPYQPNSQAAPLGTAQGGNNAPAAMMPKEKDDAVLALDVRTAAVPGTYSLTLRADTQVPIVKDPAMKDKKTPMTALTYAEPFEVIVLPTSIAKVTATPPGSVKLGTTAELTVKIDRMADYAGDYKVEATLPKDTKGITVTEATIPAGKDECKLTLTVAPDAKPGTLQNIAVAATGTVHGKFPIRSEAKFNLVVAK
jgi:hypothetical protein